MQRLRLTIDGFLAYEQPVVLDYTTGDITAVTGPNGSGKTSIPDAVAWVRYGELRVRGDGDSIINDGRSQAHVTEELIDPTTGFRWKFDRRKKRGKTQVLSVFSFNNATGDWERYGSKLIGDNQKIINDLVGLSLPAFYSLSVFESRSGNRGVRLVSSKSDERIGILTSLKPNMAVWPQMHKHISATTRETKRELSTLEDVLATTVGEQESGQASLDDLREWVSSTDSVEQIDADLSEAESTLASTVDQDSQRAIDMARSNRDRVRAQTKERSGEIGRRVGEVEGKLGNIRNAAGHVKELTAEIVEISEQIAEATERKKKSKASLNRLSKKLSDVEESSGTASEKLASLAASKESLQDSVADLEERIRAAEDSEGACVVCGSEISEDKAREIVVSLESQLADTETRIDTTDEQTAKAKNERSSLRSEVKKAKSAIDAAEEQIDAADVLVRDLTMDKKEAQRELERNQDILDSAEESETALTEQIEQLRTQRNEVVADGERRAEDYESEIAQIKADMPRAKDIKSLENTVSRLKRQRDELISTVSRIDQLTEQMSARNKTITAQRSSIVEVTEKLSDLELLREATGQRGIPFLMLSDMLTNIEARADEYLRLINGDSRTMSVDLVQDYEAAKPTLDIMVTFGDGSTRPVESLSNGEVTRVSLALMFALAHTVNLSKPGLVSDVFLDEPLAAVDDVGVDGVMAALRHAIDREVVGSVMIVAHDRSIVDACDVEVSVDDIRDSAYTDVEEVA